MKINISFLVVLITAIVAIINDILIYFLNLNYIVGLALSSILTIILLVITKKKNVLKFENYFKKIDLLFLIPYIIFVIVKIVYPDFFYDSRSYHYYLQENPFIDKINFDFLVAGGNVNSFVYPLGDRINYLWRHFLGLRLGNVESYFLIIVIFYQIKKILKYYNEKISEGILCIAGAMPISFFVVKIFFGRYYIDFYSVVFVFELMIIAITEKNIFEEKLKLYILSLISGIAVGVKISNLVFVIAICIFVLAQNIKKLKNLKIYDIFICLTVFVFPFFTYALDNYLSVGNPVFPFFGREKFYYDSNWKDPSFGIPNFLYSFIWPVYIVLNPLKGSNYEIPDYIWAYGYAFLIINIFIKILKKDYKNKILKLEILIIICTILWAEFMMGYTRYAIILPILYIITIFYNIYEYSKNSKIVFKIIGVIEFISLLTIFYYGIEKYYIPEIYYYPKYWKQEVKNVFKDNDYKIHIDEDCIWGAFFNGGITSILREDNVPVYNLTTWNIKDSKFLDMYNEKVKDKTFYIITSKFYFDFNEETLKNEGFEIIEKVKEYDNSEIPYIQYRDVWTLYKIKHI